MCAEWRDLISDSTILYKTKTTLDLYKKINLHCVLGDDGTRSYPGGICTFSDKIIVSDLLYHRVDILDKSGQFIQSLVCMDECEFRCPKGLCIVGGNLWIADSIKRRIQVFNVTTYTFIRIISLQGFIPRVITTTPKGLVLIGTEQNAILILNQDGSRVGRFNLEGDHDGRNIMGISCNSKGEIWVSDFAHQVQIFSEDGKLLRYFGSEGNRPGQFYLPNGIYIDQEEDNVFVADRWNNRICIFDSYGIPIQQVTFELPHNVCLMKGKMIVTSFSRDYIGIFSN